MNMELWVWIGLAVALVAVATWPKWSRFVHKPATAPWTVERARAKVSELESALDHRTDLSPQARKHAERHLVLAGTALAKRGRHAARRAGTWAEKGLAAVRGSAAR